MTGSGPQEPRVISMPLPLLLMLSVLGVLAGAVTTLAGLGGGILLTIGLSLVHGPAAALAATTPALLLGNLHRFVAHRADVDRAVALRFAAGALPGSIAGGLLAATLPDPALQAALVFGAALAMARHLGLVQLTAPRRALAPAGLVIGAVGATSGGAGLLIGPLFMARGLRGVPYVATVASAGLAMQTGRLVAYGAGGLFDGAAISTAVILTAAVLAGNVLGARMRPRLPASAGPRIEVASLVACTALAVVGLMHRA